MSALSDPRLELTTALEGGGVRVTDPSKALVVPGALIRPGDPWLTPASVGGGMYELRLSVLLVAGAADTLASLLALEALVAAVYPAIAGLPAGWTMTPASRARSVALFGATYLTTELSLARLVQLIT